MTSETNNDKNTWITLKYDPWLILDHDFFYMNKYQVGDGNPDKLQIKSKLSVMSHWTQLWFNQKSRNQSQLLISSLTIHQKSMNYRNHKHQQGAGIMLMKASVLPSVVNVSFIDMGAMACKAWMQIRAQAQTPRPSRIRIWILIDKKN